MAAAGLARQSSYGSLNSLSTPTKNSLKRSSSHSSIVSGTSELGYSVASRQSGTQGSSASSIKASMMGRRGDVPAVMASSRKTVDAGSIGLQATGSAFASGFGFEKRGTVDLGSLPRSLKGNGLLDACMAGDLPALRKLLEGSSGTSLSKPDVNGRDGQGKSALMLSVTSGNKAVVEYLLSRKADVNAADSTRKTALHHASKRARGRRTAQAIVGNEQIEVVALLLRARGCLEAQDSNGCTPLLHAVANSDVSVAEGLLRAGADVGAADSEGQTCLDYAVSFELAEMAQLLKRAEELRQQPLLPAPAAAGGAAPRPVESAALASAQAAPVAAGGPTAAPCPVVAGSPTAASAESSPVSPAEGSPTSVAGAQPSAAEEAEDLAAEERSRRKAEKAEKKKKKLAKEAEAAEAGGESPEAAQGAAEEAARREAEEAAEQERRKAKEEAKRKAEEAKRAAEELARQEAARQEAEERGRVLERLQALMKSTSAALAEGDAEDALKELKAAIKAAQAAGIEEEQLQEAEGCMKDLKSRNKAQEKLRQAIADRDLDKLRKAIAKAEEANVPKSCIDEAKAVVAEEEPKQQARARLQAAKEAGSLEELKAALAAAKDAGVAAADLAPYEQLKASLERREEAEASLAKAIEGRGIEDLRAAIQLATEAGVDGKQIKQAEKVLKEEEPKQRARELLREACQQREIPALKEAIKAAEAAKLDAAECAEALEVLRQEEEKMKALEGVNQALEDVKGVDMTNIDALREAKEKLGAAIQEATKAGVGESHLLDAEKRRKKIHNTIEDIKGSIRVFCRIRPLSSKEKEQGDTSVTSQAGSMALAVEGGATYGFDAVFTPGTQEEVFEDCRDLVQSAVDGYNVTMFAYGQTGAGKTFTMYGEQKPGMEGTAPRTIKEIYKVIEEGSKRFEYEVRGSMLELYKNDLFDLLSKGQVNPSKSKLSIKQEKSGAIFVEGLIDEECKSAEDLSGLLDRGNDQRTVACTAMNSASSRSHLVLIIRIKSVNRETKEQLQGKILICDLAGSERLKKSQVDEEGQKEAIEINKSLTALGDVIEALTKGEKKLIPYRNHKLTQLMQDSLGGTSKTLMFVNCSPASSNMDETVMSLKYATRAKKITNTAKKSVSGA